MTTTTQSTSGPRKFLCTFTKLIGWPRMQIAWLVKTKSFFLSNRKHVQDFGVSKDKNDLGFVTFDLTANILSAYHVYVHDLLRDVYALYTMWAVRAL